MIKVEVLETEDGKFQLFFEATKKEETDQLDRILEAIVGLNLKRGGYVMGAPNPTLKIEVNSN